MKRKKLNAPMFEETADAKVVNEMIGKGPASLVSIAPVDLEHPETVAARSALGDQEFEAQLGRDRQGLHAQAVQLFTSNRAQHNRLIHLAWLNARRVD